MSFKLDFDKSKVLAKVKGVDDKARPIICNELLKDANYFCPVDSTTLQKSAITASDPAKGVLVWDTKYARKRYYVGTPHTQKNPNASLMWAHKAIKMHQGKYNRMAQAIADGGK